MKLATLLAAGRGLITSGGAVRYRENKNVYLPKFDSAKKPLATIPAPPVTPQPAPATGPAPAKLAMVSPAAPRLTRARQSAPKSLWHRILAMFFGGAGSSGRPVRAEQTELLLDAVRVVGSDLTDVKVAVPPLKSRPSRKKVPGPVLAEWGEVGTSALEANLV